MRFLQWLRGAEAGRDRSVALRIEAALWMAPLLAPLVASGVLLVLMDGLSMATRAMVLGAGLLLSTIIAWRVASAPWPPWERLSICCLPCARATTACGDGPGRAVVPCKTWSLA